MEVLREDHANGRGEWLIFVSECGLRTVYTEPAVFYRPSAR